MSDVPRKFSKTNHFGLLKTIKNQQNLYLRRKSVIYHFRNSSLSILHVSIREINNSPPDLRRVAARLQVAFIGAASRVEVTHGSVQYRAPRSARSVVAPDLCQVAERPRYCTEPWVISSAMPLL